MLIYLSNIPNEIPDNYTIHDLLVYLNREPSSYIILHNQTVIQLHQIKSIRLKEHDRVELLHFIGGG